MTCSLVQSVGESKLFRNDQASRFTGMAWGVATGDYYNDGFVAPPMWRALQRAAATSVAVPITG